MRRLSNLTREAPANISHQSLLFTSNGIERATYTFTYLVWRAVEYEYSTGRPMLGLWQVAKVARNLCVDNR